MLYRDIKPGMVFLTNAGFNPCCLYIVLTVKTDDGWVFIKKMYFDTIVELDAYKVDWKVEHSSILISKLTKS